MNTSKILNRNICSLEQLKEYIQIPAEEESELQRIIDEHPMSVTPYYLSLIDKDDPADPIRKMSVPTLEELDPSGEYDTSGEKDNTKMPGLQHKYAQTALILATNQCKMYCRHCFRKRLVGLPTSELVSRLDRAVQYIKEHGEINNVLISGGDPLLLPTGIIEKILKKLTVIPHLSFIRIGTRTPVVFPDRILQDENLTSMLADISQKRKRIYISTQFNHPREITRGSATAVDRLIRAGIILNNQTVLLKGVNDSPDVLAKLQEGVVSIGVSPYYVFQCRPVKKAKKSFQVPLYRGYHIVKNAKKKLNGISKRFRYVMSHVTGKVELVNRPVNFFMYS